MARRTMRTFIAVPLEEPLRQKLVALQENLSLAGNDVKWVEPPNLHVTLLFLGEVDARETLDVCRAVARVTAELPPFTLELGGLGFFPNPRRPRVLWAGLTEGAVEMANLHDALEGALMDLGCYRREERGYTPHVTLGRIKSDDLTPEFRAGINAATTWRGGRQPVRDVHVLSSELERSGPMYTVLSRCKLLGHAS